MYAWTLHGISGGMQTLIFNTLTLINLQADLYQTHDSVTQTGNRRIVLIWLTISCLSCHIRTRVNRLLLWQRSCEIKRSRRCRLQYITSIYMFTLLVINTVCISANNLNPAEQLKLSLIWNRVDIALEKIFSQTTHWNVSDWLHSSHLFYLGRLNL